MKIGIVATHSFPIPSSNHTGDVVILDLATALTKRGHNVTLYAPEFSQAPYRLLPIPCSWGSAPPWPHEYEQRGYEIHRAELLKEDIVHDFSPTKRVVENLMKEGRTNVISTLMGGGWAHPSPGRNIVVWSKAMRERGLRGATDYEGTRTPEMGGPPTAPIKDARVIPGGIDTLFYSPSTGIKKKHYLWMNRWHPVKGYREAIELARETGIELVMAGERPDRELFEHNRRCACEAVELARGLPNVHFEWLPADPDHHLAKRLLYSQARALLYTVQFQEPFGLSQVEALSCGTPVIATNYGSIPEVIEHGVTGAVVENSMKGYISGLELIEELPEGEILSSVCSENAVQRFDRSVMAKNYETAYETVLAGEGWGA